MNEAPCRIYEFGPFRIDVAERILRCGAEVISLPPKAVETLLVLLESGGQAIAKETLLDRVWPDTNVEEGSLTQNVSLLRKVLGERNNQTWIDTIPKRGYRFAIPVTTIRDAVAHEPSLAVLPLDNLSSDLSQDYFAAGITDELISSLMEIDGLRVCSNTTSVAYKRVNKPLRQIARELDVDWVVEGSVLHFAGRVRITARLIDGRIEKHLWTGTYEKDMRDVLALQSEVTRDIAREIRLTIAKPEQSRLGKLRPVDGAAFDCYLRGRFFWNKRTRDGLQRAVRYFRQAIDLDPTYAPFHAGLADAYALLGGIGYDAMPPHEAMPLAKAAANNALQIDATLAEAHASLGYVKLSYDWDWSGAEKDFRRSIELNPSYSTSRLWYGHHLMVMRRPDEARKEFTRAVELDPLSVPCSIALGYSFYCARQFEEAIQQYRKTLEIAPEVPFAFYELSLAYSGRRSYEEAFAEAQRGYRYSGGEAAAAMLVGRSHALLGRRQEARGELARLERMMKETYVPSLYRACIYSALEEPDKAFDSLRKACDERCNSLIFMNIEPLLDNLRADPRFQTLSAQVGLP